MGCTSSKLDDLPAVALCRDRCAFLDEAIRQRFAISESHVAYTSSLREIGHSLHHFINHHHQQASIAGGDSPKLNLPRQRKGDPEDDEDEEDLHHLHDSPKKGKVAANLYSGSGSGSDSGHLEINSDSEDEDESDLLHHSDHSSPLHHLGGGVGLGAPIEYMDSGFAPFPNPATTGPYPGGGYMYMNYMKKTAPPSVVYEQRPVSPQRIYMGESSSSSSSYYPYNYPPTNNPYPYYGYPNSGGGPGISGGFYGSSPPPPPISSSKPPPPPPSPPKASALDFLNPFDSYEKYYPSYTPSRDSKELREEEGIPDLEYEDYQYEVVKEVHGDQKLAKPAVVDDEEANPKTGFGGGGGGGGGSSTSISSSSGGGGDAEASLYQTRPSAAVENERMEYEVHVVEKKVVGDERKEEPRQNYSAAATARGGGGRPRDGSEVAKEIEVQFQRAAESGNEIAKILEAGKLPYNRKHASSKMLHMVTPSLSVVSSQPSTSKSSEASSSAGSTHLEFEEELALRSRNLSSTLHKLYLWEKKLYNEVKAEERMRVAHDKKVRKLKRLDERGAEAHKVDSTRTLVRSMSTKIRIAVQVVDKISVTINKIRDEELWPQLDELIRGFTRMWKSMLECHHIQCQAIREARGLGPVRSGQKLSEAHLDATRQLEQELINWTIRFANWVGAQKGFIKSLNNWLLKCLLYEPEETPDGIAPFSPGRMGAPLVFVICNQWSQSLERISESEVLDSMRSFLIRVLQLWEQDKLEMRQSMMDMKDLEKKVRNLDREDQKIQKEIQALEKKIVLASGGDGNGLSISGNAVYQSDTGNNSLQGSLERIFDAMARFSGESMKAYEELLQRAEEEMGSQEREMDS